MALSTRIEATYTTLLKGRFIHLTSLSYKAGSVVTLDGVISLVNTHFDQAVMPSLSQSAQFPNLYVCIHTTPFDDASIYKNED